MNSPLEKALKDLAAKKQGTPLTQNRDQMFLDRLKKILDDDIGTKAQRAAIIRIARQNPSSKREEKIPVLLKRLEDQAATAIRARAASRN